MTSPVRPAGITHQVAVRCGACDARHPGQTAPAFAVMFYGLPQIHQQQPYWYKGTAQTDPCWWLSWLTHRTVRSAVGAKVVLNGVRLEEYAQAGRRRVDPVMPEGFGELVPLLRRNDVVQLGPCRGARCKAAPRARVGALLDKATPARGAGAGVFL